VLPGGYSHYLVDCLSIIVIDLLLAGDNALVIALAVRALPMSQRRVALVSGAGFAVLIRVAVTFLAAKLLRIEFLQFAGGVFVIWIAVRVLADASAPPPTVPLPRELWRAIGSIMVADLTMSTDNILAVAGASKGNTWLILFGLALSIPVVMSSSTFLAMLMDKYPLTMYLGAAILGKVGGDMMLADAFVRKQLNPSDGLRYAVEAVLIAAVLVAGRLLCRSRGHCPPD
jgi:YjbE family integral membrane protein